MKVSSSKYIQLSRLCRWRNLLFFVPVLSMACRDQPASGIAVIWEEHKAAAVHIPSSVLPENNPDSARLHLKIKRAGDTTGIIGFYRPENGIVFRPVLPLLRGAGYTVWYRDKQLQTFTVPSMEHGNAPKLMAIYPQKDTLPVNLLKLYFEFSQPMRENVSDRFIRLIRNGTDTLPDAFLNLQPELWNYDRTVLTVWFDPGRIKRDLQPNLRMGAPLEEGNRYRVWVSDKWQDAQGVALVTDAHIDFVVSIRDSTSPDTGSWTLHPPPAGSTHPLIIDLHEPLDHFLLKESLSISDRRNFHIPGRFVLLDKDSRVHFIPDTKWKPGQYQLFIDTRLEDHAGNNLNKPFERNMKNPDISFEVDYRRRIFSIR